MCCSYDVKFHSFCLTEVLKISLLNKHKFVLFTLSRKSWKMQWVRPTISTQIWMTSLVGWHRQRQHSTIWNQWAELSPMSLNKYRNKRYVLYFLEFSIWKISFVSLNCILTRLCSKWLYLITYIKNSQFLYAWPWNKQKWNYSYL